MRETTITLPELGMVAGTRAALGVGLGLLFAGLLTAEQRRAIGWTLVAFGAAVTGPLAVEVLGKVRSAASAERLPPTKDGLESEADRIRRRLRPEERVGYAE